MNRGVVLLGLLLASIGSTGWSQEPQDERTDFVLESVTDGLGIPWGMAFLSADALIVTEREGRIRLLQRRGDASWRQGVSLRLQPRHSLVSRLR